MKQNKWLLALAITGLLICAALPQLLIYYKGYYYVTDAPGVVKYPVNAGCFLGVALLGGWYLKQYPSTFLRALWRLVYLAGGLFIMYEYVYHFIHAGWGVQTYLGTMGLFEILVSPLPFIIAWLLMRTMLAWDKAER